MPSIRELITFMSEMPIEKGENRCAMEPSFLKSISNRATFDTCRARILAIQNSGRTFNGSVYAFYDKNYEEFPYTFRAGSSAPKWNNVDMVNYANKAINPFVEQYLLVMDPWTTSSMVEFFYVDGGIYLTTEYVHWSLALTFKSTEVKNIRINGNADNRNPINIIWDSSYQDAFEVSIIQNGATVYTAEGQTEKSITIPAGKLQAGTFTVNLITANNPYENWGEAFTNEATFTATSSEPIIYSLEPNSVNQSVNAPINVTWASDRQDVYNLNVYSNNRPIKTYTGMIAKQVIIPKDTLPTGNIRLDLVISNTISGITLTATKQATFLGYGKPPLPIFEDKTVYSQAKPLIKWEGLGQVAYILEIYQNNTPIETSGEIASTVSQYQVASNLTNNTTYTIKLKVKNQYDLWSDISTKDINISFTELPKPDFTLTRENGAILITIVYPSEVVGLKSIEIYRKDPHTNYKRMAYNMKSDSQWVDNTVASGVDYTYKVFAISNEGGVSESDSQSEKTFVNSFFFDDIESKERKTFEINPDITIEDVIDRTVRMFAGASKPKIEKGKTNYRRLNATFTVLSSDYEAIKHFFDNGKVILFRDLKGAKFYGSITSPIPNTYLKGDKSVITFTFEEVNFIEKDIYSDQKLVLTYFNGAYFFDGSIDFSGVNLQ